MQPNQYQQYPQQMPQGYGQPQYAQPPQAQQYQQQYAPAAPVFNGQPAPAPAPSFNAPATAEAAPRIKDLGIGRLIMISPKKIETVPNTYPQAPPGSTVDKMTADLWVLDGEPFAFGGSEKASPPRPHSKLGHPVAKFVGAWIQQAGIVNACRETLDKVKRGEPAFVVGRINQNPASNAWFLTAPSEADLALAGNAFNSWNGNRVEPLGQQPNPYVQYPQVQQHAQQMPPQVQQYAQQPVSAPQGWANAQPAPQGPPQGYADPAAQYQPNHPGQAGVPPQHAPGGWVPGV